MSVMRVSALLLLFSLLASDTLIQYRLRWVARRTGTPAARAAS